MVAIGQRKVNFKDFIGKEFILKKYYDGDRSQVPVIAGIPG